MTTPYTPSATHHAAITTIDDDDEPSGALFTTPLTELADNIELLRTGFGVSPSTVNISLFTGHPQTDGGADQQWFMSPDLHPGLCWVQGSNSISTALTLLFDLSSILPVGTVVTGVDVHCRANWNHVGHLILPGTMPAVSMYESDNVGGATLGAMSTVFDPSANVSAYAAAHTISGTGLSTTISATKRLMLKVTGEFGLNSLANCFAVTGITVTKAGP